MNIILAYAFVMILFIPMTCLICEELFDWYNKLFQSILTLLILVAVWPVLFLVFIAVMIYSPTI